MEKQNEKWGIEFPLGVNEKVINIARIFIEKYSKEKLNEVAKLCFKTTNKL